MLLYTMNQYIEQDNIKLLDRFKYAPPHPSYIAGFIDGDGCIFIRKISDGYQSGITITQSRTNVLQIIRYHFGGSITSSANRNNKTIDVMDENYYHKYNIRNQYNLIIRSNEYNILLDYLQHSIIIKQQQFACLRLFNKLTNLPNKIEEKDKLFEICTICNQKCNLEINNLCKLNIEYIQGLFDAEGCIFIGKNKNKFALKLSQKNHPLILYEIQKFLGFGKVCNYNFEVYKKSECIELARLLKPGLIVKYKQICAFDIFLQTINADIKEEMYIITNEEKHKIEIFNNFNQNEYGKEGYFETLRLRELKDKICKQICIKELYRQKSEKMMGTGNHNYGKKKSEKTRKKLSVSIRDAKNGVPDEPIIQVKELIHQGYKNIDIQEKLQLPRHTVTRIKNGIIVCRNDDKIDKQSMSQQEVNISKRKILLYEIIIILEKCIEGIKPTQILNELIEKRSDANIPNTLTIDIVKNTKRNFIKGKKNIYEGELELTQQNYFDDLIVTFTNQQVKH